MGSALLEVLKGMARAITARLERLFLFLRDIVFPGGGDLSTLRLLVILIVIAAAAAGAAGARILIEGDPPTTPDTPIAAGGPGVVASASPAVTASPTPLPPEADSPEPAATPSPDPTPEPTPTPSPTPGTLTIRGPIDTSAMSGAGLVIGAHEVVLSLLPDGGPVSGAFTVGVERFPIGALLTKTFDGEDDPDYAEFKTCTVTLTLVGTVSGTYDEPTGKLAGKAAFRAVTDDVDDCLKTRPSNLTIDPDKVAKPTTVTWQAKFNGTRATGVVAMKPDMDFTATIED